MKMNKIYQTLKNFLKRFYTRSYLLLFITIISTGIGLIYSKYVYIVVIPFSFSVAALIRLTTYKTGKISFFMRDKTWNVYEFKYSKDEIEEKFKEMSIKRATIYFALDVTFFIIWVLVEVIAALISLV